MQINSLYQQIADAMQQTLDNDLVMCIEAACVTEKEWEKNPEEVKERVGGALEEITDYDDF